MEKVLKLTLQGKQNRASIANVLNNAFFGFANILSFHEYNPATEASVMSLKYDINITKDDIMRSIEKNGFVIEHFEDMGVFKPEMVKPNWEGFEKSYMRL